MHQHVSDIVINEGYSGLNPTQFGYEYCKPGHDYGPVVRTYWLLHYVVSGHGHFEIHGERFDLGAGDMFVIPPEEASYYCASMDDPWHYIWVGFTAASLPFGLDYHIHCPELGNVFHKMLECLEMKNGKSAFLSARLWDMMSVLLEKQHSSIDHVEKAVSCMRAEYMTGISVQQVADRLNLERSYFSALFRRKMGLSPQAYLMQLRMENAALLLTQHAMTPSVAAACVGYSDIYNFSRMFRKFYGMSPRAYQKQHAIAAQGNAGNT